MADFKIAKTLNLFNEIDIFLLDIHQNSQLLEMVNIIPKKQLDEINQYKFEKDRFKRQLARSFLYWQVQNQFQIQDFSLAYNQYKKPYLSAYPGLSFNFSYAGHYVLVSISNTRKIGCDIEYVDTKLEIDEIAPHVMHSNELVQFQLMKEQTKKYQYFYQLFSNKESVIKAFGTGLYFDVTELDTTKVGRKFKYQNVEYQLGILELDLCGYVSAISFQNEG